MMDKGTYWYRQGHIFSSPFTILIILAQVIAFQYWHLSRVDREKAWESYYKLCTLGGTKGFIGLISEVNLKIHLKMGQSKKH